MQFRARLYHKSNNVCFFYLKSTKLCLTAVQAEGEVTRL